jgi:hypothetical protein
MKSATAKFEVVPLSEVPRKITSIAGNKPLQGGEGSKVPCEEKARLARAYDLATSRFSEAVRELHRKMQRCELRRRRNMIGSNELATRPA